MADQHRATDRQWALVRCMAHHAEYSTILELLHRIEALEATAKSNHPEIPDSSLVERVRQAQGCGNERDARAAIREVALWLSEHAGGTDAAWMLEREAER